MCEDIYCSGRLVSGDPTTLRTLRKNGWTSEKGRVGSPPLAELPLQKLEYPRNSEPYRIFHSVEPTIQQILQNRGIDFSTCDLIYRTEYGRTPGDPTVYISAPAKGDYHDSWALAVEEIRLQFREAGLTRSRFGVQFRVEIMDPEIELPMIFNVLEPEHPLACKWDALKREVIRPAIGALLTSVANDCHVIEAWRYGFESDSKKNPPTVVISILPGHPWSDWRVAEEKINRALPSYGITDGRCLFVWEEASWWAGGPYD